MPLNAGNVNDPPVKVAVTSGSEAARPTLLPAQMLALVGVMVGALGVGFTVITTSLLLAVHGLLLIVQRSV